MTQRAPSPSAQIPPPALDDEDEESTRAYDSVISAHGAFRLLLIALSVWTFFEGFALTTSIFSPVDVGAGRTAERMLGGLMLVLAGVYAMIAWQRERYRLLLWVPFAAQLAIVVPLLLAFPDGALLLVISSIFLALMCYVWWRSRHIELGEDDWDEEDDDDDEDDAEFEDGSFEQPARKPVPTSSPASGSRSNSKFRRRDA